MRWLSFPALITPRHIKRIEQTIPEAARQLGNGLPAGQRFTVFVPCPMASSIHALIDCGTSDAARSRRCSSPAPSRAGCGSLAMFFECRQQSVTSSSVTVVFRALPASVWRTPSASRYVTDCTDCSFGSGSSSESSANRSSPSRHCCVTNARPVRCSACCRAVTISAAIRYRPR